MRHRDARRLSIDGERASEPSERGENEPEGETSLVLSHEDGQNVFLLLRLLADAAVDHLRRAPSSWCSFQRKLSFWCRYISMLIYYWCRKENDCRTNWADWVIFLAQSQPKYWHVHWHDNINLPVLQKFNNCARQTCTVTDKRH